MTVVEVLLGIAAWLGVGMVVGVPAVLADRRDDRDRRRRMGLSPDRDVNQMDVAMYGFMVLAWPITLLLGGAVWAGRRVMRVVERLEGRGREEG